MRLQADRKLEQQVNRKKRVLVSWEPAEENRTLAPAPAQEDKWRPEEGERGRGRGRRGGGNDGGQSQEGHGGEERKQRNTTGKYPGKKDRGTLYLQSWSA
ncbi:unnamed protein product [Pleuronectes platessa]|uniref:Uncharacterized protein n=1 Tax=Pleuronectes platessa TaxID=8262 RepID=A0A9N7V963_PLEPL|nr:unnamed protein product [Pleuronectes platessa]